MNGNNSDYSRQPASFRIQARAKEIPSRASTPKAPNIICGSFTLDFNELIPMLSVSGPCNRKSALSELSAQLRKSLIFTIKKAVIPD